MNSINPIWLRYGILYGVISILISLLSFYVISIGSGKQIILSFVIMVLLMVFAGKAEKLNNDGALSYGDALKTTFLTGFVGVVINILFSIILLNLIDPGLIDKLTQQSTDFARWMMELFGAPDDQIEQAMDATESKMSEAFTPLNQILSIFQAGIYVIIIAAILSIFIKKAEDINKIDINSLGDQS